MLVSGYPAVIFHLLESLSGAPGRWGGSGRAAGHSWPQLATAGRVFPWEMLSWQLSFGNNPAQTCWVWLPLVPVGDGGSHEHVWGDICPCRCPVPCPAHNLLCPERAPGQEPAAQSSSNPDGLGHKQVRAAPIPWDLGSQQGRAGGRRQIWGFPACHLFVSGDI